MRRSLARRDEVSVFLGDVLGVRLEKRELLDLSIKISQQETLNSTHLRQNTLVSEDFRDPNYKDLSSRMILQRRIVDELWETTRPDLDEMIAPGNGGSKPKSETRFKRCAYIVIGPPASGKSTIANAISDVHGAIILDADHAKRKLPEYDQGRQASLVHHESSLIVFGVAGDQEGHLEPEFEPLISRAISNGANVVIPRIGKNAKQIEKFTKKLKAIGYSCQLVLASLDRVEATRRTLDRFRKYGRYVPLSYVFDEVANEPQLTYYRLRMQQRRLWSGYAAYTTESRELNAPAMICHSKSWRNVFDYETV